MKTLIYEVIFEVTETLQNGKERKINKSVYMSPLVESIHVSLALQIEKGTAALKKENYSNIQYVTTKNKYFLFA